MDCVVLQKNLHDALGIILRTINTKNDLPVLAHVLLQTKEGKLFLSGTNLELGTRIQIGAKVETEGSVTVPARLLWEFVAALGSDKVTLSFSASSLMVKGPTSQASFTTIPASEFPSFPEKEGDPFPLSLSYFQDIANLVTFAASGDEGRPVLTGVQMKSQDQSLVAAATDGFRLSICRFLGKAELLPEGIIPAKTLNEIAKIGADRKAKNVEVFRVKNSNQLIFSIPEIELFSRLLDGEFPNYSRIVPTTYTTKAIIDKDLLLQAVKAASIFARESANIVRLKIEKDRISISANTPQIGEEKSEIEAKIEGDSNEVAFNFRFLLDFVNSISGQISLEMTTPLSPVLFRPLEDASYVHIIMPVRVQQ